MCNGQRSDENHPQPRNSPHKMQQMVVAIIRILFVIVNNLYCIPVHLLWLLLLQPLRLVCPSLYWKLEGTFFRWLLSMVAMWSYSAGYDIVELGDDVWKLSQDRTVVMYNHQSTSDVPLIMAAFNSRPSFSCANVMWIMDRVFRLTNFGVVSLMHGDFFIRAGKTHRDSSLLALRHHLSSFYQPMNRKWIVLFPEGGFLIKRKPISQKYGQKLRLPHLQNVSLPRSGALKAILDHSHHHGDQGIKWIVDVTVGYPGGDPLNLQALIAAHRPPCAVVMHYRCYDARHVPRDETALTAWLYDRYIEKEQMLSEFYATGVFPDSPSDKFPVPPPLPLSVSLQASPVGLAPSAALSANSTSVAESQNKIKVNSLDDTSSNSGAVDNGSSVETLTADEVITSANTDNIYNLLDSVTSKEKIIGESSSSQIKDMSEGTVSPSAPGVGNVSESSDNLKNSSSVKDRTHDSMCSSDAAPTSNVITSVHARLAAPICSSNLPNGGEETDLLVNVKNINSFQHSCVESEHSKLSSPPSDTSESPKLVHRNSKSLNPSCNSSYPDRPQSLISPSYKLHSSPESEHRPDLGKLPGNVLVHDPLEFALRHLFYIVSTYVATQAISSAYSYIVLLCC
ncbi:uncharacterized protein LOC108674389 [Hyalella azteca]|uniref:Uncharacterized protein LOC108674389 n=1 Tax=Hyalella azteca TaxID=294128 RepID=A0A979FI91_HYAAZ|nr:uncharacterized protein LOC108674389 [Hyalella azteca]